MALGQPYWRNVGPLFQISTGPTSHYQPISNVHYDIGPTFYQCHCFGWVVKFVCRHSIARPRKPPGIRKVVGDIAYIGRVIADFVPKFVAMATGLVAVEFGWRHSIARPRKPPVICKDLGDISYIGRVIADFVPKFVAMATGVIRCDGNGGWSQ